LIGETDQAGIREVNSLIAIFFQDLPNGWCLRWQLKQNREESCDDIFDYSLGRAPDLAEEIARLGDNRFTSDERGCDRTKSGHGSLMRGLSPIQQSYDCAGVEQYGFDRPYPSRCFLFVARSPIPESNFPRPMIARFFLRRRVCSRRGVVGDQGVGRRAG
jgi:hypothetical protein